jgi:hypothetical protein
MIDDDVRCVGADGIVDVDKWIRCGGGWLSGALTNDVVDGGVLFLDHHHWTLYTRRKQRYSHGFGH